jgi:hypothetical protein
MGSVQASPALPAQEFRCPRCGTTYPRSLLERFWSEWGRICWCPPGGTYNARCRVFAETLSAATQTTTAAISTAAEEARR